MFSALKRIKDDDRKLYELNHKTGDDDFPAYEYPGAALALIDAYRLAITEGRSGN